MSTIVVALIAGGASSEREISLKGGDQIFAALDKSRYTILRYDPRDDIGRLVQDAGRIDTAFINLHGRNGEDGTVQGLLDLLGIPYQCSGVLGSALATNKLASKRIYEQAGLPVSPYLAVRKRQQPDAGLLRTHLFFPDRPLVVKPVSGGSSIGMSIISEEAELPAALEKAWADDDEVLLESFVDGRELTVGIIGNDIPEALPVVEIIPGEEYEFFDYEAKYKAGATREICPAEINEALARKAQEFGRRAHTALFCKGYSRTDMIARGDEVFVLETNTIPGMVPTSLLPLAARAAGMPFSGLLDRLISLSLEKRG
ncbi:MAG: D-alanine--D-alanine ligase [Thermodesulfobacteriota bacterium]